ncbi:MAG: Nre family DNA repair protein [Candidatus Aenigmatarchaeota archaeon]
MKFENEAKKIKSKRFIKIVKAKIPWLSHVIDENLAGDLNIEKKEKSNLIKIKIPKGSRCIYCRGAKLLCGKSNCPVIQRAYSFSKIEKKLSNEIEGCSPPSIFVGRIGYPIVYAGPAVPPVIGDTSIYDTPELWLGKDISELLNFRFSLIRGKTLVNVKSFENSKFIEKTQELALSKNPVEAEMILKSKPSASFIIDSEVQPFGPGGVLKDFRVGEIKSEQKIERIFYDKDLKAEDAIIDLYKNHLEISKIQKAFSIGMFGLKSQRRLVPTRWSITAVDSIISKNLIEEIKQYPWINEYRIYEFIHLDRKFVVFLLPDAWSYELIEAWYPRTTWNPNSNFIAICSDGESYFGRSEYPSIGGCYFAARLAVAEALKNEKRQGRAIVISEAYPGHIMPVGVWEVRESVREALKNPPQVFNSLEESLRYLSLILKTKLSQLLETSENLRYYIKQERLTKFLK